MIRINEHYSKLHSTYLFTNISRKVESFQSEHPDAKVIKMGIGDITKALPDACIDAFHRAVDELADDASFRGYGPEQGYDFLRTAVAKEDFQARGADIKADEVFISDGAKCDTGNFQELFHTEAKIAVQDPVYPVYVDTNVMAGRTGDWNDGRYEGMFYLESTAENGFVPAPPDFDVDLIYLCSPNNPTGSIATRGQLAAWVDYAKAHKALILFDSAYVTFLRDDELPHSIYEIPGAKEVAVEFRSYSKTAGFTGTRCAYTVIPKECRAFDSAGQSVGLAELWNRRQTTKFNGVSYPVQRAAEAVHSGEGKRQIRELADYYLENARIIREGIEAVGLDAYGGIHSPYIWVDVKTDSWDFFDSLLEKANVVCTPGSGFGRCGEGFARFSAFNDRALVNEAMQRIKEALD